MKPFIGNFQRLSKGMILAFLAVAWIIAPPAHAKVYQYQDDKGVKHYTDDPGSIPKKYWKQIEEKKYRGITSAPSPSKDKQAGGEADKGEKPEEGEGLSDEDISLINKSVPTLSAVVALGNKYKSLYPIPNTGMNLSNEIKGNLPKKKSLAKDLEKAKAPELKSVLGFLKKSIAGDEQVKTHELRNRRFVVKAIERVVGESKEAGKLLETLKKALEEGKKKAEDSKKEEPKKKDKAGAKSPAKK